MTDDPIALLSRANPVPPTVTPAPIEDVLARIEHETPSSGPRPVLSRARPLRFLAPTVAVSVALAIAAAAFLLIHGSAHQTTAARVGSDTTPSTPATPGFVPKGGMRGTVLLSGIAFTSHNDGVVSLQQCTPCSGKRARTRDWLATTNDSGRSWKVVQAPYVLQSPAFADAKNGWAFGISASRTARYYVTHDSGASWRPAHLDDGQIAYTTPLAVAGNTAWAIGNRCPAGTKCTYAVLRGTASGSTLSPTVSQPAPDAQTMIIAAGSGQTAYVTTTSNGGRTARTYATHDGGRHWTTITRGCPESAPTPTSDSVLWEACHAHTVAISSDGGKTWHRHTTTGTITDVVPTSATTAWALTDHGALLRTTTAGRTWHRYPYRSAKLPRREMATPTPLSVLSATSAAIAVDYPTGHGRTQIMVVRALGPASPSSFIKLPPGLP